MKKILIISLTFFFICNIYSFAQAPLWAWAKSAGGIMSDQGNAITTDKAGNIYATGNFSSTSITIGNITLNNTDATGSSNDIFVVKYSPSGNVIRAWNASGSADDYSYGITTDTKGNVYIVGEFQSPTLIFGNITLTIRGTGDVFIAKFDSLGNALWAKSTQGNSIDYGYSIATDAACNAYITGGFMSSVINFDTLTLTNAGTGCTANDVFTAKYDTSGNAVWAKSGDGTGSDFGRGIKTDRFSNVYVTGEYTSLSFWFGNDTLTNFSASASKGKSMVSDIFIVKYDALGNVLWAKSAGGSSIDYGCSIDTLNSDVYITGAFASDSIVFDTISMIKTYTNSSSNIFVAKYNSSGDAIWARQAYCKGIYGDNVGFSINTDIHDNINVTGTFSDSLISFGSYPLLDAGFNDIFITQYDVSGNVSWAKDAGGKSNDYGYGITSDVAGYIYLTGYFQDSVATFGSSTLLNAGGLYNPPDIFVSKLNSGLPLGFSEVQSGDDYAITVFPNPTNGSFLLIVPKETKQIQIINSLGQTIQQAITNGNTKVNYSINVDGIYFIRVINDGDTITKKIIVCRE